MTEEKIVVDMDSLTWGELEEIEKMVGGPTTLAMLGGQVFPSAVVALVYVVKRRDNPQLLLEEVRRLPIAADIDIRTGKEEVDPETGKEVDPTSATVSSVDGNGDSPPTPSSAASTGSVLPSFEG